MMGRLWLLVFCIMLTMPLTDGGPVTYWVCQAGCAAAVCACYAAGGLLFDTFTPPQAIALSSCNAKFGQCSAACAAMVLLPTP